MCCCRESKTWDPAATVFVKNLIQFKPKAEFLPLQKGKHGSLKVVFGKKRHDLLIVYHLNSKYIKKFHLIQVKRYSFNSHPVF